MRPQSSPRWNFNPRPPQGARPVAVKGFVVTDEFQSTRSARSATPPTIAARGSSRFQSTRSARSATLVAWRGQPHPRISIHALRKERDGNGHGGGHRNGNFNPRAPQGARLYIRPRYCNKHLFQSTRSARSATSICRSSPTRSEISIHALRKERDFRSACIIKEGIISIHALRKERDFCFSLEMMFFSYFNPRAPQGARLV